MPFLALLSGLMAIKTYKGYASADSMKEMTIEAQSGGIDGGNFAKITVDGQVVGMEDNVHGDDSGLHIVVIDPMGGGITTARVFDTSASSEELEAFIRLGVPVGHIVVAACKGDCAKSLSFKAKQWF